MGWAHGKGFLGYCESFSVVAECRLEDESRTPPHLVHHLELDISYSIKREERKDLLVPGYKECVVLKDRVSMVWPKGEGGLLLRESMAGVGL